MAAIPSKAVLIRQGIAVLDPNGTLDPDDEATLDAIAEAANVELEAVKTRLVARWPDPTFVTTED